MEASVSILQEGTTGQYLAGQGIGSYPVWIDPIVLTAGSGLSGGGDISADRTFDLDINSLSAASIAAGDFIPLWDITATATNKKITFANFEGTLNHDSLSGVVANEHIDHSGVSITAGSGLSGGGDITVTRTIDLDINSLSVATIAAGDFVPFWDLTSTATNKKITFANFESTLNHDNLFGFVMNEHIDHSGVTITAGSGLSGTSDITASFTLNLDINELSAATIVAGDFVPFWDLTATATNKKTTFANFEAALTHDSLLAGTIVSHDTTATGANLTSMTDDSMVDSLHRHSELSASDGTPNAAFAISADGTFTFSGGGAIEVGDTTTSTDGVILKDGTVWFHNFHHPTGNGAVPNGQNIFLGELCGNFTTGSTATAAHRSSQNIAIGYNSLTAITTGYNNVAIGANAANSLQTGISNVCFGLDAFTNAVSGNNNVVLGSQALRTATAGSGNFALGTEALYSITTTNGNVAIGSEAGRYLSDGSSPNQTSSYSLFIGAASRASTAGRTNELVFGRNAIGSGSNTITLGGSAIVFTIIPYGKVGVGTANPNEGLTLEGGVLSLLETTTPTATANYAKIYSKNTNTLWWQDGAGNEHLLHGDSFSNIWFHDTTKSTITISTSNLFTKITSFDDIGEEDDSGNSTGNISNNEITVGANGAGRYKATFHTSITSNGASSEMLIAVGQELNSALSITVATNATPIVCTSAGHEMRKGDMVTISGCTGNDAANGDWFISAITTDTFTLKDLQGNNSVGNGVYDTGTGNVDIVYHGNVAMQRVVSQNDLGSGGANADVKLNAGDKVAMYVANIGSTRNLEILMVNLEIFRIGD